MYGISCLSSNEYKVVAETSISYFNGQASCEKMYNVYNLPEYGGEILKWITPFCAKCEKQGMFCRLKKNSNNGTECFGTIHEKSRTWVIAGEHFVS